jgi:hypothetical protein
VGGIGQVVHALAKLLPPWALAIVIGAAALFFLRGFGFRTRSKQVREAVRRLVRATPETRDAILARAFERAGDHPDLLALLASEAARRGMPRLHADALAKLEAVPGGAPLAAKLRREATREAQVAALHPVEVAVRVRALLDQGLVDAARARLDEATAAHADHPSLVALRAEIEARAEAVSPPP